MNNKFKTANDLKATEWNRTENKEVEEWVKVKEFKESAIQDLKAIEKVPMNDDYFECITLSESPRATITTIKDYIKWKFNLKEEDLK